MPNSLKGSDFLYQNPEDRAKDLMEALPIRVLKMIRYWLRNYGVQGILDKVNGIIFGKPLDEKYYEEYKKEISMVLKEH